MDHIDRLDDERIALYTRYNEPQLFHYNEPGPGIFIAETPMIIERAMDSGAQVRSFFVEEEALDKEVVQKVLEKAGDEVALYVAPQALMQQITGFHLTRGMLAAFERPKLPSPEALLQQAKCVAVLENVENPTNLGAIFRSAAALGVDAILITSDSTDPFYRRAARVSMGSVFQLPWTYVSKEEDLTDILHRQGFAVISMALMDTAIPLTDPVLQKKEKKAIIFGSEGYGIRQRTLEGSDHIVIIPMYNGVDSLNVAASSAVAFWELCGKTKE